MNKHRKGRGGHQQLRKYPLTNQLEYIKNSILPMLMKDFNSQPFLKPVDYKKLKLSDYPKIILHPIDLGTIKSRLTKGYYSSSRECISDVNSVFTNCFIFNTPEFEFCKMAQTLSKIFDSLLKDMPSEEYRLENSGSGVSRPHLNDAGSPASCCSSSARDLPASSDTAPPIVSGSSTIESSDLPASLGSDSATSILTTVSIPPSSSLKRKVSDQTNCLPSVNDNFTTTDVDLSNSDNLTNQPTGKVSQCETPISVTELDYIQQRTVAQLITPSPDHIEHPLAKKRKKETMTININDIKTSDTELNKKVDVETPKDLSICVRILDILTSKKHQRWNRFFMEPVDVTQEELSDYYEKIIMPMDFGSIRKKLNANLYDDQSQFVDDVNLIFNNCYQYNGEKHFVSNAARRLKSVFDDLLEKELTRTIHFDTAVEKSSNFVQTGSNLKEATSASESISTEPVNSHFSQEHLVQPSSDTILNDPRDVKISDQTFRQSTATNNCSDVPSLDFCHQILKKLHSTKYKGLAYPFLKPVDVEGLGLDQYYEIVEKPMDLQTVRHNLESGKYQTYMEFADDVRLIFDNCVTYNGKDHEISIKGKKLQKHFESLLTKHLKSLKLPSISSHDEHHTITFPHSNAALSQPAASSSFTPSDSHNIAQCNSQQKEIRHDDDRLSQLTSTSVPLNSNIVHQETESSVVETVPVSRDIARTSSSISPPAHPTNLCREVDIDAEPDASRICDIARSCKLGRSSPPSVQEEQSILQSFISSARLLKSILEMQHSVIKALEKLSADFREFACQHNLPESSLQLIPHKLQLSPQLSVQDRELDNSNSVVTEYQKEQQRSSDNAQETGTAVRTSSSPKRRSSAAAAIKRIHGIADEVSHSDVNTMKRLRVDQLPAVNFNSESHAEMKLIALKKYGLSVDDLSIAQSEKLITFILSLEPDYSNSLTLTTFRFTIPLLKESTLAKLDAVIDQMLSAKNSEEASSKRVVTPPKVENFRMVKAKDHSKTRSPRKVHSSTLNKNVEGLSDVDSIPLSTTNTDAVTEENIDKVRLQSDVPTEGPVNDTSCVAPTENELDNVCSNVNESEGLSKSFNCITTTSAEVATSSSESNVDKSSNQKEVNEISRQSTNCKSSEVTSTSKTSDTSEDESDSEDSPKKRPMWGISRKSLSNLGSKSLSNSINVNTPSDLDQQKKAKEAAKRLIENQTKRVCQLSQKEEQCRLAKEQAEKEEIQRNKERAKLEEKQREELEKRKEREKKEEMQRRKIEDAKQRAATSKFSPEPLNLHEILCDFENKIDPELFDRFKI